MGFFPILTAPALLHLLLAGLTDPVCLLWVVCNEWCALY